VLLLLLLSAALGSSSLPHFLADRGASSAAVCLRAPGCLGCSARIWREGLFALNTKGASAAQVSPDTAMVVGVEAEFNTIEEAYRRTYVRKQQVRIPASLHPLASRTNASGLGRERAFPAIVRRAVGLASSHYLLVRLLVPSSKELPSQRRMSDLCGCLARLQILQWQFMAAPNHPVLVNLCRTLAAQADKQFHEDSTRDTLDRTGPGPFSDAVTHFRDRCVVSIILLSLYSLGAQRPQPVHTSQLCRCVEAWDVLEANRLTRKGGLVQTG
jgi:hypothetical protein